jgi:hypothetical protein
MFMFLILFLVLVAIVRSSLQAIPLGVTLPLLFVSFSASLLITDLVLLALVARSFHRNQLLFS